MRGTGPASPPPARTAHRARSTAHALACPAAWAASFFGAALSDPRLFDTAEGGALPSASARCCRAADGEPPCDACDGCEALRDLAAVGRMLAKQLTRACTPCMYTHVDPHVHGMCMACTQVGRVLAKQLLDSHLGPGPSAFVYHALRDTEEVSRSSTQTFPRLL